MFCLIIPYFLEVACLNETGQSMNQNDAVEAKKADLLILAESQLS